MAARSADFSSRRLRGELNIASAAFAPSRLCIPTRTFSRAVMFWNRRMFWKVRPIPAFTMSFGRALRNVPPRRRRSRYQRGRPRAARSIATSRAVATTSRMPARSGFPVAAKATRASTATMPAGVTHVTGSNQVRTGLAIIGSPLSSTTPLVGLMTPATTLKKVVLPAPLGPIRLMIAPRGISRSTSRTATRPPNVLVTLDARRMGPSDTDSDGCVAPRRAAASAGGRGGIPLMLRPPAGSTGPRPARRPPRRPPRGARADGRCSGRGPRAAAASSRRGQGRTGGTGTG